MQYNGVMKNDFFFAFSPIEQGGLISSIIGQHQAI
jgi:hypothetical protein